MEKIDKLYRAFYDYRRVTENDRDLMKDRLLYSKSGAINDSLQSQIYQVKINKDWIEAIEDKLDFIAKAIKEDRQFIRTNGEVIPIEKVKRVSKASVSHLARHSNLITKEPIDDDIKPEKLYQEEKLTDYAVYENRFLYMLLIYLKEFIFLRQTAIKEKISTFIGKLNMDKSVNYDGAELSFKLTLNEKRLDNPIPRLDDESKALLIRMEELQTMINSFLKTPLMQELAKVPIIKPPLVKTNVLRMNNNFKACVALYEYIANYLDDGYEATPIVKNISPFTPAIADEMVETISMSSYLTFNHGNNLENYLYERYLENKKLEEEQKAQEHALRLNALKRKASENEMSLLEYMLALEKRNSFLESAYLELIDARKKIEELKEEISTLEQRIILLNAKIDSLCREIDSLHQEIINLKEAHERELLEQKNSFLAQIDKLCHDYDSQIDEINAMNEHELDELRENHTIEINELNQNHAQELHEVSEDYQLQINEINISHEQALDEIHRNYTSKIDYLCLDYQKRINMLEANLLEKSSSLELAKKTYDEDIEKVRTALTIKYNQLDVQSADKIKELQSALEKLDDKYEALSNNYLALQGQIIAESYLNNTIDPNQEFTTKESFTDLERQYEALRKFYNEKWKEAKKKIRREILK